MISDQSVSKNVILLAGPAQLLNSLLSLQVFYFPTVGSKVAGCKNLFLEKSFEIFFFLGFNIGRNPRSNQSTSKLQGSTKMINGDCKFACTEARLEN